MEMPPGLGGKGTGRNPEELFGMGFSTCFAGAMGAVYRSLYPKNPKFPSTTRVDASVHLGTPKDTNIPGFMLGVKLEVPYSSLEGSNLSVEEAKKLVEKAHEFCPYSRATRGNIEVEVKLV
ncbi:OsmC-like protein, partial [Atractiella rhizophila]